ncbi:MAG: alpha/beta fold hydrolase, partial [Coprobacillaceae bacterium]
MISYVLETDNCTLQIYKKGNTISKIGVLCLHGGPGSGAQAIMDLPAFHTLEKNYCCVYFDQRGSGNSVYDLENGLMTDTITSDVLHVIKDMKKRWLLDDVFLFGGSFGGCLASLCLERFPEQFRGCILSSPAITFNRLQALSFYVRMREIYINRLDKMIINKMGLLSELEPEMFFTQSEIRNYIYSPNNPANSLRHICAMSSWFFMH